MDYSLKMYETDSTNGTVTQNLKRTVNNFSAVPWVETFERSGENNICVLIYPLMQYEIEKEPPVTQRKSSDFLSKLLGSNKNKTPIPSTQKITVTASTIALNNDPQWCFILKFIVGKDYVGRPVHHTLAYIANESTIHELFTLIQKNSNWLGALKN